MTDIVHPTQLELPVLPLRDVVVFPHMVIPLFVGRARSINALELAMDAGKSIFLVAQKEAGHDNPGIEDIYTTGTIASILQMLKMPDGTVKVLVEGERRGSVVRYTSDLNNPEACLICEAKVFEDAQFSSRESDVLLRTVAAEFEKYVKLNPKIPPEILTALSGIDDLGRVADTIAAHLNLKNDEKQTILELYDARERLEHIFGVMDAEIDLLQVEKRIRSRVKKQMEKSQREYYLNEQMKAIQKELGDMDEGGGNENDELAEKISTAGMPKEAREKSEGELKKLKMMSPMSAEATVVRNYIDWLLALPWNKSTRVSRDLAKSQKVLDTDHYGLEKVKDRILEYLAVQKRVKKSKAAILCLVGPPGVGKTSLGESIARATNRKFIRMSLGGVRDEAEIRGHRRTYIGSMPGKIIQNLSKVKTRNPLFMLDEVDKMSMDFRGDPSSALLEVLDPEQNHKFGDHYLEVDFDLSDVMFIATANTLNIPGPLLDRMEVIRISGYTDEEKEEIARRYLLPKQRKNNGLKENEVSIGVKAVKEIIASYTREAGVRSLEREISKIYRKIVKELLLATGKATDKISVTPKSLEKYLGVKKFRRNEAIKDNKAGQVTGLAWTEVGGELLTIEAVVMPGKGKHVYTGKLGDVMQESITAAMSVVRSRSKQWGIDCEFYATQDVHVHVPEGATPKDGPSAGIGMCTSIVSSLTGIPALGSVAMTGEITLRGEVLPIGGLKEKLLAAHRAGIKLVIIPHDNERDLQEIPEKVKQNIEIKPVKWIDEVIELALESAPQPVLGDKDESESASDKKQVKSENMQSGITAH